MSKNRTSGEKQNLHIRNRNRDRYDLDAMEATIPELSKYVQPNKRGEKTINFSDPVAVRMLNQAILHYYYGIKYWEFPEKSLCPPIPGRAEYIHHVADLLSESNDGAVPIGQQVTCLDIGLGASCIYPIIGVTEYKWNFIGTDINPVSVASAQNIVKTNSSLKGKVNLRLQENPKFIFKGIIKEEDKIDITICNPPFHASIEEALKGTKRKVRNLTGRTKSTPTRNFSGEVNELVYKGGEFQFVSNMIKDSKEFAKQVFWYSVLVSKESNLRNIYHLLDKNHPSEIRTIDIRTGNKTSRVVAWTYLTPSERKVW